MAKREALQQFGQGMTTFTYSQLNRIAAGLGLLAANSRHKLTFHEVSPELRHHRGTANDFGVGSSNGNSDG
jgi:hypothetical protein